MKVCDKSICKPLDLIFPSCIKHGEIPTESKKANVALVNKKVTNRFYKKLSTHIFTPDLWEHL